jgi:hypothetical protein
MSETTTAPVSADTTATDTSNANEVFDSNANEAESTNATPAATPPAKKKFTYKADGKEISEELDDSELVNRLSLSKAAMSRMQEATQQKKQIEQFLQQLQNDPLSVLNNDKIMGKAKFREIAEKFLTDQLQQELLSPEERARAEMEERLKSYEQKEKERQEAETARQSKILEEHYAKKYEETIISALNSSNLPKTPYTVARMATLMQKNLQHGLDLEPNQIAQLVFEEYQSESKAIAGNASVEQLLKIYGEDVINKIRKFDLERIRGQAVPKVENTKPATPMAQERRLTPREYTEQLRAKFVK